MCSSGLARGNARWLPALLILPSFGCSGSMTPASGNDGDKGDGDGTFDPDRDSDGDGLVDGEDPTPEGPGSAPGFRVGPSTWKRLTEAQLNNSMADLFGAGLNFGAPEPDHREHGFLSIGAATVSLSAGGVERMQELAFNLAGQIMQSNERRSRWVSCDPSRDVAACARESVQKLGRAMFRRPLDEATVSGLVAIAEKGATSLGDAWKGLEYALAAMLQSPRFLYIQEKPAEDVEVGRSVRVDDYTLAARLSFFLWNTTPDEDLLRAADEDTLHEPEVLAGQIERLLGDARAPSALRDFFASAWGLYKAPSRRFEAELFPNVPGSLGQSALEESLRYLELHLIERQLDLSEALLADETFVNRDLAPLYGVPTLPGPAFKQMALPASSNRHGLFTQVAFLSANSTPDDTQPMLRGKTIRQSLLCQEIPEPPPDLMAQLPPLKEGENMTKRDRLAVHREDPFCAACHDAIDPPGLALENYDPIGAHRDSELGLPIDASGELDGIAFDGPETFVRAITQHPEFVPCFVRNMFRFATAHVEQEGEEPVIDGLIKQFEEAGRVVPELVKSVATGPAFLRMTVTEL